MKVGFSLVAITLLLAGLMVCDSVVAQDEIQNLARNGDFENGLIEWVLNQNIRGSVATMEEDRKDFIEGSRSVYIDINTAGADFHTVRIEQSNHVVEQNDEYTMSAWIKAEGTRNARFHIFDVGGGAPWFTFLSEEVVIDTEWTEYFGTFDAGQATTNASISLRIGESDINVWVDDIKFYEGEYVPTELVEGPQMAVRARGKLAAMWGNVKRR